MQLEAKSNPMMTRKSLFSIVFFCFALSSAFGQGEARKTYIATYSSIAMEEMKRAGVPASITLAQGILESGNGLSELAAKSNNHFGIKCHSDWEGERVYHDDDEQGECFRKYKNVRHSFEDHSDFLVRGSRYDFLFDLDPTDYKNWAKGLKKAGYATAPDYAERLIEIIEDERLFAFDGGAESATEISSIADLATVKKYSGPTLNEKGKPITSEKKRFVLHRVQGAKGSPNFVVLQVGESIEAMGDSLNMRVAVLLDINDATWETVFEPGDKIYVDYKKTKAKEKYVTAKEGQSMRDIAQQEGIKLQSLYHHNHFAVGHQPKPGDQVRIKPWGLFEKRNP